jgi:hypothetical protein
MCAARFISVVIRSIEGRWWVVEGVDCACHSQSYFLNHGRDFATRDQAFEYGAELAALMGMDPAKVFEESAS